MRMGMHPASVLIVYLVGLGLSKRFRHVVSETFRGAGTARASYIGATLAAMLLAQAFSESGIYPIVTWKMYSETKPIAVVWNVRIARTSGFSSQLRLKKLIVGPNPRALLYQIRRQAQILESGFGDSTQLTKLLAALHRLDRNLTDPIDQITVERCRIRGKAPWGKKDVLCEPIFSYLPLE